MNVLFLVPYPTEAPSNRLRIEQYFPYLRKHGVKTRLRPFMSRSFFRRRYRSGEYAQKAISISLSIFSRLLDIRRAAESDVIVVHREAFPFGGAIVERAMAATGRPIVFDFDDAIYLPNVGGEAGSLARLLRRPEKTARIIELSSVVIAGNDALRQYARQYNDRITVIPTPVDTDHFRPQAAPTEHDGVVIGWIGSNTTAPYLKMVEPALEELSRRHPGLELRIVGGSYQPPGLPHVSLRRWGLESELRELHGFDIGIMPMPDTEWTRGKCGFKTLFYMSVGLPSVSSPVGITTDIIQNGCNGYLASSTEEWVERLGLLIEDAAARRRVGLAGRQTVEEKFSLHTQAPRLLAALEQAAASRG